MRSTRGYLDALVRSARAAGPNADAHAALQPDWMPTRIAEPVDDLATAAPPRPSVPARRSPDRSPGTAPPRTAAPTDETRRAMPHAVPRSAMAGPLSQTTESAARTRPAEPAEVQRSRSSEPVVRVVEPAPAPVRTEVRIEERRAESPTHREALRPASLRLPPGTEAALERLEHLTRRLSKSLPPVVSEPDPAADTNQATVTAAPEPPRADPPVITLEPAMPPTPALRMPERERVEIGSIEVYVTQPPRPEPALHAAPVSSPVAAPPARSERLSRPWRTYGLGQG